MDKQTTLATVCSDIFFVSKPLLFFQIFEGKKHRRDAVTGRTSTPPQQRLAPYMSLPPGGPHSFRPSNGRWSAAGGRDYNHIFVVVVRFFYSRHHHNFILFEI